MTPWTIAYQAPLSMEFPRKEHWSRKPFPPPGGNPGIKPESPMSPALQVDSLLAEPLGKPSILVVSCDFWFAFLVSNDVEHLSLCLYLLWGNAYWTLPIFNWIICLFFIEYKSSLYFRYKTLIRYMICKFFFPFWIIFLVVSFRAQFFFKFWQ